MSDAPALPRAELKARAEDFIVEELPAYAPSGEGEHVFVRLTKTDRTTLEAVRLLCRALGCDDREAGFAGMKDRRAVTTQTVSLRPPRGVRPQELVARAREVTVDGISIVDVSLHGHKLKPGHLTGNRFSIALRGVDPGALAQVEVALARLAAEGAANAFGAQRFGRDRDNATRALAWLRGDGPGPRDPRLQRLLWSALQSSIFNQILDARVADGTWRQALAGDVLKLRSSGGLFVCTDPAVDGPRVEAGEVSPTGPLVGVGVMGAEGAAGELERKITAQALGDGFDLGRTKRLGEGTRRALRVWVQELRWELEPPASGEGSACVRVYFVLPKGAYATTALSAVFDLGPAPPEDFTS